MGCFPTFRPSSLRLYCSGKAYCYLESTTGLMKCVAAETADCREVVAGSDADSAAEAGISLVLLFLFSHLYFCLHGFRAKYFVLLMGKMTVTGWCFLVVLAFPKLFVCESEPEPEAGEYSGCH